MNGGMMAAAEKRRPKKVWRNPWWRSVATGTRDVGILFYEDSITVMRDGLITEIQNSTPER